ncbi:bisanhydrobacterioruberin hydratase [Candidatus Nanohalovita haloferacivicina]|uniref:bisanhydrobacterioruberin hydratase n=1 Tax=Candidatus Nanohalovita haloferacivicina TaxID=2978046 RepID=UPI00325F9806|nr:Bisanhydrobacterioruberin hydratase [Candidatus Nanohalobia archaeon BNXNv]
MDRLEELVSENRFTISVVFPIVGAATFLASAEGLLPGFLEFNPFFILFGTLVMRTPLIAGLRPLIDRKAGIGILAISLYAYLIEFVGLSTGWPYGDFSYLISLGPMVHGVPVGLPVFFVPLVLNSFLLVRLYDLKDFWERFLAGVGLVLLIDAVLDPAAVALGIWSYGGGLFYGVPLSNFTGWLLSASICLLVLEYVFRDIDVESRLRSTDYMLDDMVSFVFLWGFINLYYLNPVPVLIAAGFGVALYQNGRFSMAVEELPYFS